MANLEGHGRQKRRRFSRRRRPVELEPLQGLLDRGTFHRCSLGESLPSSALIARRSARSWAMVVEHHGAASVFVSKMERIDRGVVTGRGSRASATGEAGECRSLKRSGAQHFGAPLVLEVAARPGTLERPERSLFGRTVPRVCLVLSASGHHRPERTVPRVCPVLSASGHHRPRAAGRAKLPRRRTRSEPRLRPRRALERIHKDATTTDEPRMTG